MRQLHRVSLMTRKLNLLSVIGLASSLRVGWNRGGAAASPADLLGNRQCRPRDGDEPAQLEILQEGQCPRGSGISSPHGRNARIICGDDAPIVRDAKHPI
jgi:hypothetical protein